MQKILSLCYPTYNRGWCMKQQIERLQTCPQELLDKVEILISDNCSTDDTQAIVEDAVSQGFRCRYIRNETNLGMDGNFVSCFRKATGKYVWLLGDDDVIIPDSLSKIVAKLEGDEDYGLLHIEMSLDKNKKPFVEYIDDDQFCKDISFWFTFISGNIPQTKYVKDIPFEKYMGTWFTLIPLYFKSLHSESKNLMANFKVFDDSMDSKRNGGYNFFQVFVANYLNLLNEFKDSGYITETTVEYMKKNIFSKFTIGFIERLLIKKEKNNLKSDNGWSILYSYYGKELYFYWELLKIPFRMIFRKQKKLI